jgi:hypothetical protein
MNTYLGFEKEIFEEYFQYDPKSGSLMWKKLPKKSRSKIGSIAGAKNSRGYLLIKFGGKSLKLHRIIFFMHNGFLPDEIDHVDHNKLNNKIENLRPVSHQENHRNMRKQSNNSSGHVGIYFDEKIGKYRARIGVNSKAIHLGSFSNINDAIEKRRLAEIFYGFHENHGKIISH